jgi:hypothetical protein
LCRWHLLFVGSIEPLNSENTDMKFLPPSIGYDPRGIVETEARAFAQRPLKLQGLRLAVLDNAKMKARKLLEYTTEHLNEEFQFSEINYYVKRGYSYTAEPEMLAQIAAANDVVVTAIGD